MLPEQLRQLKDYLQTVKHPSRQQRQLLHELSFLNGSKAVQIAMDEYSMPSGLLESLVVAAGTCPNCGKKY